MPINDARTTFPIPYTRDFSQINLLGKNQLILCRKSRMPLKILFPYE